MPAVFDQDARVTRWVADQLGHQHAPPAYSSIGWERDGELVAGVFFDGMTETNVFAHTACSGGVFPRGLLIEVYRFVFERLGAKRMTFMVNDNNLPCVNFVTRLGAKLEAVMRGGHASGNTLIFVLRPEEGFYEILFREGKQHED